MNYPVSIILGGAVLIFTISLSEASPEQNKATAGAAEIGPVVRAPEALRLKIVQNGFQLDWTLSRDDPSSVTAYEIVRADRLSGPFDPVAMVEHGTSVYIDTTAMPEIICYFKVRALNGEIPSLFSNIVAGER